MKKRIYYVINDSICENFGYNKYITREHSAYDILQYDLSLAKNSDVIIVSDSTGNRYLKNRLCNPTSPIDPDEFMFIVLSSTEDTHS